MVQFGDYGQSQWAFWYLNGEPNISRMHTKIDIVLKIVLAALLVPTYGSSASIESLVTQADAVIIGVGSHPVKNGRVVVLPLLAQRVFKGSVAPGTVINLNWDSGTDDILWKTPPVLHGLWFLRSSTDGWEIISAKPNQSKALSNLLYRTSSGPLPAALAYGDNEPLVDKLILEVGAVPTDNPSDILQATSLRSAAAQALSAIHTREALPHLAALLDDPNPELVSYGIVGLSLFANGVGTQTTAGMPALGHLNKRQPGNYRTSETEQYLGLDPSRRQEFQDFWRRWWNANRASLGKE